MDNNQVNDDRQYKNLRIKKSIFQEMGGYCYEHNKNLAICVEDALTEWLDRQYQNRDQGVA